MADLDVGMVKNLIKKNALLTVPNEFLFLDTNSRNTYFTNNPSKLQEGISVVINKNTANPILQRRINNAWQDISGVIKGKDGNGTGIGVDETQTLYFREGSNAFPNANDIRLRKGSQYLYFERYEGNGWVDVAKAGGSIITDKLDLTGDFARVENETPNGDVQNVWRLTSHPNGNEIGSSARKLWFTASGKDDFSMSYAMDWHDSYIQNNYSENLTGNLFEKTFIADANVELEYFAHNLYAETKVKLLIKDIAENRVIYETMNDAEFIETGGVLLKDYATNATTGLINVRLKHVAYLVQGREYKITIKASLSGYKGFDGFPFLVNRGKLYADEKVASREWVQETQPYKRLSVDGSFYLKGNETTIGSIRAILIDNMIHYQELKPTGWEIANVYDIKLGARGLLSERLDALENAREFQNSFDATGTFTQLNNSQKGYYWLVAVAGTIGGKTLGENDMIICHTAIANPTNFNNFAIIPSTTSVYKGATTTENGVAGLFPPATIAQKDQVPFGDGSYRSVAQLSGNNDHSGVNRFIDNNFKIGKAIGVGQVEFNCDSISDNATVVLSIPNNGGTIARTSDIPVLDSTLPTTITINGANAAGASDKAARIDHAHNLPLATTSVNGAMSSTDKIKLDGFSPLDSNTPVNLKSGDSASAGSSNVPARRDHKHLLEHVKMGFDLTVSTSPKGIYRDKMLTSGTNATTISVANIPWVFNNIDEAERSLPYWIQELSTFFKNLENDNQFDQLVGGIPANFSIPLGSWGVAPSASTDMDNAIVQGSGNYAGEYYEFIVGRNSARTEVYTFSFTFASLIGATFDTTVANPFRLIYQTTRNASSQNFVTAIAAIATTVPRCTVRPTSFALSSYNTSAFPLMYEPITLEIDK